MSTYPNSEKIYLFELLLHRFDDGRPESVKRKRVTAFLNFDGKGFDKTLSRLLTKATDKAIKSAQNMPHPRTFSRQAHSHMLTFNSNRDQDGRIVGNPKESAQRIQRMHTSTHNLAPTNGSKAYLCLLKLAQTYNKHNHVSLPAGNKQTQRYTCLRTDDPRWNQVPQIQQRPQHNPRVDFHYGAGTYRSVSSTHTHWSTLHICYR